MMKILNADKSVLMEIETIVAQDDQIRISGKIMGAMPMKAVVEPAEIRAMMRRIGFLTIVRLVWLVMRPRRS